MFQLFGVSHVLQLKIINRTFTYIVSKTCVKSFRVAIVRKQYGNTTDQVNTNSSLYGRLRSSPRRRFDYWPLNFNSIKIQNRVFGALAPVTTKSWLRPCSRSHNQNAVIYLFFSKTFQTFAKPIFVDNHNKDVSWSSRTCRLQVMVKKRGWTLGDVLST